MVSQGGLVTSGMRIAADGLLGGTVRMSALVVGQPEETQRRIREAFDRRMEEVRERDGFVLPVSVKLASGRKP
jgi:hypothetical protein